MYAIGDFAGAWRLQRRIEDARDGRVWDGVGRAALVADGRGGLIHDETVILALPGQAPLTGTRRYLWAAAPGAVAVSFADGRPFHTIALGVAMSRDTHDCPPDRYVGRHDFARWPVWVVQWDVLGPRKEYRMITTWTRAG